jgi:UDP-2-acetamido-3-amino-2,3-dideoxy-glucuronate N-acetyltransferase
MTYLQYPNNIQGHIYVSWLHPFKEHRLVIIGSKGTLHFEDSALKKPLLFYEKVDLGDSDSISIKNKLPKKIEYKFEFPLHNELKYFIDIINDKKPIDIANIKDGINVVRILEMASNSLVNKELDKNDE